MLLPATWVSADCETQLSAQASGTADPAKPPSRTRRGEVQQQVGGDAVHGVKWLLALACGCTQRHGQCGLLQAETVQVSGRPTAGQPHIGCILAKSSRRNHLNMHGSPATWRRRPAPPWHPAAVCSCANVSQRLVVHRQHTVSVLCQLCLQVRGAGQAIRKHQAALRARREASGKRCGQAGIRRQASKASSTSRLSRSAHKPGLTRERQALKGEVTTSSLSGEGSTQVLNRSTSGNSSCKL